MAVFDVLNPLGNVTPKFTEEELQEIVEWFDQHSEARFLTKKAKETTDVITVDQLQTFLELNKYHRRCFHYPSYNEIVTIVEQLKVATKRILTKAQFIYMLNKWIIEPDMKHELILAYKVFDTEKKNFFDLDELRDILSSYPEALDPNELREYLRDVNINGDGNIYYEDFVNSMFTIAPELYDTLKKEYLYDDPDEDPSVPPLPEPEPEPEPEPPPPPPPPKAKGKKGKKK